MNKLPALVVNIIMVCVVVVMAMYAQARNNYVMLAASIVIPFAFIYFTKLSRIAIFTMVLYYSYLIIPFLPIDLMMYQLAMLLFVGMAMAQRIVSKESYSMVPGRGWAYFFLAVIGVTIYMRGFGLRFLGGSKVGGAPYIHILIGCGFLLLSDRLVLTARQWKLTLVAMVAMGVLPVILHTIVILTGGSFYYPLYIVKVTFGLQDAYVGVTYREGLARLTHLSRLGSLCLLPALLYPFRMKYIKIYFPFMAASLVGALLSGVRKELMRTGLLIFLLVVLTAKRSRAALVSMVVCGALGFLLAVQFAEHMPYGAQRVLTMVPGVRVSAEAQHAADSTVQWRYALWTLAWEDMDKHWVVGKGFGYNAELMDMRLRVYSIWDHVLSAYVTGDLHFGAFSVLYTFGVPGLISIVGLIVATMVYHVQRQRAAWADENMKRYHFVVLVYVAVNVIFHTIGGAVSYNLPPLLFLLALLNGLAVSDSRQGKTERDELRKNHESLSVH